MEQAQAMALAQNLYGGMRKLALSTLDGKLRETYGTNGLAGIYILRSFHLLIGHLQAEGMSMEELAATHQQMVEVMRKMLTEHILNTIAEMPKN